MKKMKSLIAMLLSCFVLLSFPAVNCSAAELTPAKAESTFMTSLNKAVYAAKRNKPKTFNTCFDGSFSYDSLAELYAVFYSMPNDLSLSVTVLSQKKNRIYAGFSFYSTMMTAGIGQGYKYVYTDYLCLAQTKGEWKFTDNYKYTESLINEATENFCGLYGINSSADFISENYELRTQKIFNNTLAVNVISADINDDGTFSIKLALINGLLSNVSDIDVNDLVITDGNGSLIAEGTAHYSSILLQKGISYIDAVFTPITPVEELDLANIALEYKLRYKTC